MVVSVAFVVFEQAKKGTSPMRYTVMMVLIGLGVVWSLLLSVFGLPQPQPNDFKPFDSWWATALYNYQTLITGILAVGAAGLTINQMRSDDKAAQRRHEQQTSLTLRADALKVDRVFDPHVRNLIAARDVLLSDVFEPIKDLDHDGIRSVLIDQFGVIAYFTREIGVTLMRPAFQECSGLFSGKLNAAVNSVVVSSNERWSAFDKGFDHDAYQRVTEAGNANDGRFLIESWLDRNQLMITIYLSVVLPQLGEIIDGVSELHGLYKPYLVMNQVS